jgi:hypothetical protein
VAAITAEGARREPSAKSTSAPSKPVTAGTMAMRPALTSSTRPTSMMGI